jgi:DinB superfamily
MHPQERQLVLNQLAASEARLLDLVANLTPQQWHFREAPDRWSIAENIEHVILVENFLKAVIAKTLAEEMQPEKKPLAAAKEPFVLAVGTDRSTRFNAREIVRPTGSWPETAEMIVEFQRTRAQTRAFVTEIQGDLRSHFFAHVALGDLDCYQWLVVMAQHGARHALQIEQIKADPGYPSA